jgi:hypothetical protein
VHRRRGLQAIVANLLRALTAHAPVNHVVGIALPSMHRLVGAPVDVNQADGMASRWRFRHAVCLYSTALDAHLRALFTH